jgi:hypothetical protein
MSAVNVKLTVEPTGVTVDFEGAELPRKIYFNGELSSDIEGLKAVIAFVSMYCARRKFTYELVDKTGKQNITPVESSDQESDSQELKSEPKGEDNINAEQGENHKSNSEKSNGKKSSKKADKKGN